MIINTNYSDVPMPEHFDTPDPDSETDSLTIWSIGKPVPQGSKKGFVVKGRAVLVDDNKDVLKPWRAQVARDATNALNGRPPLTGPVAVTIQFWMPRPASVKRAHPHVKPDLDKLIRAIFDALTTAQVWGDDGQAVTVHASKVYADNHPAGVRIQIERHL